ncbi:MAG: tryptophan--tRNA ligase [Nitrososphaerota archaeon]|nr:tryptophan--tRNA ligase [Candidatus Geocrenenecus dongiae]
MVNNRAEKLIREFGLDELPADIFKNLGVDHHYVRRRIIFACRTLEDLETIVYRENKFYALTGIMPSHEKIHLGTAAVIESMKCLQKSAKLTIVLVADLESLATRNIDLETGRKYALNYHIPTYLALGLDPQKTIFYFQSENIDLQKIAFDASKEITLSELEAIYGTITPGRILSAFYQIGDILFPQLVESMLGVIPVGLDQDPHIRLCRDYIKRTRNYDFRPIIGLYITDIPSLRGEGKMSKSDPYSAIFIPEEDENFLRRKIYRAFSGGAPSLEEQRKRGANLEIDVPFQLLRFLLPDDNELKRIAEEYGSGKMISGEVKEYLYNFLKEYMKELKEKIEQYREIVNKREILIVHSKDELKQYL